MNQPRIDTWCASYKPYMPYNLSFTIHLELIGAIGRGENE